MSASTTALPELAGLLNYLLFALVATGLIGLALIALRFRKWEH